MTPLHELQRRFVRGVLHDDASVCAIIAANGLPSERRLAIYRNNAREGFLKTLAAAFPVIERLGGAGWFRQIGTDYMREHPSRSGNLHFIGERFATYLDARLRGSPYEYFADVARLEWAYQEVLVAADHPSFDVAALQSVAAEDYDALTFLLHPAARLVASTFPILAIWKLNQPERRAEARPTPTDLNETRRLSLDAGASHVLVIRREDHVELRELPPAEFALLQAFASGKTFSAAAEAALAEDAAVDLGAALAHLMQLGAFIDFAVQGEAPSLTLPRNAGEGMT